MRSLRTADYTAAEVEAQLRAPACQYTARFEVLDRHNHHAGDLDGVVYGATVAFESEDAIQGSLDLELLPDDQLADALFTLRLQPWFGVVMPDGGTAEYPQGVYVWTDPDREIHTAASGQDVWKVSLPDLGWVLEMGGPGTQAFRLDPGDAYTDGIRRALRRAGFDDVSGVVGSDDELVKRMLSWSRRRNIDFRVMPSGRWNVDTDTTPETWRTIIGDLTDALGYDHLWFDAVGQPRAAPHVDLATADPDVIYRSETDGILLTPIEVTHDLARAANRVFCAARARRGDFNHVGEADLNDILPDHPLAERNHGTYIDLDIDVPAAQARHGLDRQARRILFRRLGVLEEVSTPSLAWPVHEAYDLVGVQVEEDERFGTLTKFNEVSWDLTMRTEGEGVGTMNHRLRKIAQTTNL